MSEFNQQEINIFEDIFRHVFSTVSRKYDVHLARLELTKSKSREDLNFRSRITL